VNIRRAEARDFEAIRAVAAASWADVYANIIPPDIQAKALASWYTDESFSLGEIFVAEEAGVVGFAQVVDGELARIYVVPSRQREGVGSRLLAAFPRMPMRVTVERDNTRGRAFYEKHGFVFDDDEVVSVFGHDVPVARFARRARILLVRHGRSAHVHRGWIDYDGFLRWRESYEAAGIHEAEVAPDALRDEAANAVIVASNAPRAIATAALLADDREVVVSPLVRELELPPPRLRGIRLPLPLWAIAFAIHAVIKGHASPEEQARANEAADWVEGLARQHDSVLVVTHGAFRMLLAHALERRGWRAEGAQRGRGHWSVWRLTH
jgi:broad specificity phosphatase PhoE/GNAT superfamily N-acetyltransferase